MSKFDYMNFEGGKDTEFVTHAKKFSKEEAIKYCLEENDWKFEGESALRIPSIEDVYQRQVKYFINRPDYCGFDTDGGCYTYCSSDSRGSFPVWVIDFAGLRSKEESL